MTTPYPFQTEAVRRIDRFGGRCLICHDMGLGKSFTALLWASKHPECRPIVVVCPASIKWVWEQQAADHFGWRAEVLSGTRPPQQPFAAAPRLIVVNYDVLWPWMPHLEALKPGLLIVDESQFCQGRSTQRTKAVRRLAAKTPKVLALSGTPLVNRPAELWPTLNILRPDLFPGFWPYGMEFCSAVRKPWSWEFKGATNTEKLNRILTGNMMSRVRKADVLKDLPAKQRSVVPLEIEDRKQYEKARDEFVAWLAERMPQRLSRAERAMRLVQFGYLKRLAAYLKLPAVFDWVDGFLEESDGKLILFAIHRKVLNRLEERYAGQYVRVDGSVTGHKRRLAVQKFLTHRSCRLFLGNIQAAGVGWSAKGVSNVAFAEFPWSPGAVTQAEDRCHGIGRGEAGKHVSAYYLVAKDTIESSLVKLLQAKQKTLTAVLDNGRGETLDIYDRLTNELLKERDKHARA